MIKIKFLPTGHIFLLPDEEAKLLKEKSPDEYIILEKNGRKVKDKVKATNKADTSSILPLIIDK